MAPESLGHNRGPGAIRLRSAWLATQEVVARYDALTFPRFSKRLSIQTVHAPVLMIVAVEHGRAVGAVIAEHAEQATNGRLLSCWVRPDRRNEGVGTALLQRVEDLLRSRGCTELKVQYRSNWTGTAVFEHMLKRSGWRPPYCSQLLCVNHDLPRLMQTPWLQRAQLPEGVTMFPWEQLTSDEKDALNRTQATESWFDNVLTPFQLAHIFEPNTSFGLRQGGEVIGWIVRHLVRPDTLQCTALTVRSSAPYGCGLALLKRTITTQIDLAIPNASYMIDAKNRKMIAFMRRRLAPHGMTEAENRVAYKAIG